MICAKDDPKVFIFGRPAEGIMFLQSEGGMWEGMFAKAAAWY